MPNSSFMETLRSGMWCCAPSAVRLSSACSHTPLPRNTTLDVEVPHWRVSAKVEVVSARLAVILLFGVDGSTVPRMPYRGGG